RRGIRRASAEVSAKGTALSAPIPRTPGCGRAQGAPGIQIGQDLVEGVSGLSALGSAPVGERAKSRRCCPRQNRQAPPRRVDGPAFHGRALFDPKHRHDRVRRRAAGAQAGTRTRPCNGRASGFFAGAQCLYRLAPPLRPGSRAYVASRNCYRGRQTARIGSVRVVPSNYRGILNKALCDTKAGVSADLIGIRMGDRRVEDPRGKGRFSAPTICSSNRTRNQRCHRARELATRGIVRTEARSIAFFVDKLPNTFLSTLIVEGIRGCARTR